MGRGRQKAKHTKVARELKYFSPDTNYGALERELTHASHTDDYVDKWADDAGETQTSDPTLMAGIDRTVDQYGDDYDDEDNSGETAEPQSKSA